MRAPLSLCRNSTLEIVLSTLETVLSKQFLGVLVEHPLRQIDKDGSKRHKMASAMRMDILSEPQQHYLPKISSRITLRLPLPDLSFVESLENYLLLIVFV